jgi:hypothetical protein
MTSNSAAGFHIESNLLIPSTGAISSLPPATTAVILGLRDKKEKSKKATGGDTIIILLTAKSLVVILAFTHAPNEYPARSISLFPRAYKYRRADFTSSLSPVP